MEVLCPWALVTFKILPTLDEEVAALSDEVTSPLQGTGTCGAGTWTLSA